MTTMTKMISLALFAYNRVFRIPLTHHPCRFMPHSDGQIKTSYKDKFPWSILYMHRCLACPEGLQKFFFFACSVVGTVFK